MTVEEDVDSPESGIGLLILSAQPGHQLTRRDRQVLDLELVSENVAHRLHGIFGPVARKP
jgi:hypothetical protein